MTEFDWLSATDPEPMLTFLLHSDRGSQRKLRQFFCACARRMWPQLGQDSRIAVITAERYIDGLAGEDKLRGARRAAQNAESREHMRIWVQGARPFRGRKAAGSETVGAARVASLAVAFQNYRLDQWSVWPLSGAVQTALLRDIFGLMPFRRTPLHPSWRTTNVIDLARTIYEERTFDRLPILADALMDAGCTEDEILMHCRSEGPHVRGCWVIDLLLGKT